MAAISATGYAHGDFARTLTARPPSATGALMFRAQVSHHAADAAARRHALGRQSASNDGASASGDAEGAARLRRRCSLQQSQTARVLRTRRPASFVAESGAGRVLVLRGADEAGAAAQMCVFADTLDRPYGIAFYPPGTRPEIRICRHPGPSLPLSLQERRPG